MQIFFFNILHRNSKTFCLTLLYPILYYPSPLSAAHASLSILSTVLSDKGENPEKNYYKKRKN